MCPPWIERVQSNRPKHSIAYKKELEAKGVILPSTVDCVTGRRTELNIEVNEEIPKESLLFLKSTFNTCPDVLHVIVRSVESDLKLHVDALLLSKDANAISRLECNITDRNFEPPRFKFPRLLRGRVNTDGQTSHSLKESTLRKHPTFIKQINHSLQCSYIIGRRLGKIIFERDRDFSEDISRPSISVLIPFT